MMGYVDTIERPANPVAAVIEHGSAVIVTEPLLLMRDAAIRGARDEQWLHDFVQYAAKVTGVYFEDADVHRIGACWPDVTADRMHLHISA